MAGPRVSPPRIFPVATRSSRPPADAPGSGDTHRQTGFVLGDEVDLVLHGLNLEGEVARASAGAKFRNHAVASVLAFWSRSWLARLQALHAIEWGNYASTFPLVRAATEFQTHARSLLDSGGAAWVEWLESGGIARAHDEHATEFRLQPHEIAEAVPDNDALAPIWRASSALSSPHVAVTLALVAGDSTSDRVLVTFGDRDFHLALAEVGIGWLLALSAAQLEAVADADVFSVTEPDAIAKYQQQVEKALARRDRARVDAIEREGEPRFLWQNWRRTQGAAPKRLLL